MFFSIVKIHHQLALLVAPSMEHLKYINNAIIEAFGIHLRNIIDFLFIDDPKPSDIVASDFLIPHEWMALRPPISPTLQIARVRANKEIAHLTTERIFGTPPQKQWDFDGLAGEIRQLLRLFVTHAKTTSLSPIVTSVIR
jgi:hypothetical protein